MGKLRSFKVISEKTAYESHWLSVSELVTQKDGILGSYSIINRSDCVCIIIENYNERILLIRQFRFPTREYGWELPMGGVDNGETSNFAAIRETCEEVGINVNLKEIGIFHPMPGLTRQSAFIYYGKIDKKKTKEAEEYNNDIDEIVERRFFSFAEIKEMIRKGKISDGLTLSSLAVLNGNGVVN